MSATALLQKAAEMGTTASNTSLLRGFGIAGSDTSSGNLGSAWKNSRSEHGKGTTIIPSMVQPHQFIREPPDLLSASLEFGNAVNTNEFTQPKNVTDNTTLHEIMNSLSGSISLYGGMETLSPPLRPTVGDTGNLGRIVQVQGNRTMNSQMPSRDTMRHVSHQAFHLGTSLLSGLSNLSRGEDGPSDRMTHDFLGVGASGMVGAAGGVRRTLSQRDLGSITCLGPGMDTFSNARETIRSVGVSHQSPTKSYDD